MSTHRVVVTGLGIVSPLGHDLQTVHERAINGLSGIAPIQRFDTTRLNVHLAGEVRDFDPSLFISKRALRRLDLSSQYALYAAHCALHDAGIDLTSIDNDEMGVVLGSGMGGMTTFQDDLIKAHDKGNFKMSPLFIPMIIPNMISGNVAIEMGAKGHCETIATACASANHAIGAAYTRIREGQETLMITGGAEAGLTPYTIAGFDALTALTRNESHDASRPFDVQRDGFVIAEGAGVIILESLEHAQNRNAKIYGEIVGFGSTCDAYHMTAPDGIGAKKAIEQALKNARITTDDVDYVNAHGTSTVLNDTLEAQMISELFESNQDIRISSTKSMHGHALGAAAGIEAVLTLLMMRHQCVYPNINVIKCEPNLTVPLVTTPHYQHRIKIALSNSFGFGGHNSVIVFKEVSDEH